ncbi:MAG: DUF2867 domain-containing protein, partial [Nitratireductor sp.]
QKIKEIEVEQVVIDRVLPNAEFADSFWAPLKDNSMSLHDAALKTLTTTPGWFDYLLRLRNLIVTPFGIKAEPDEKGRAKDAENFYGFFPLVSKNKGEIILGFNDKHLDFRVLVYFQVEAGVKGVCLATIVKKHNLFGRIYLKTIMPFHKLIVPTMLKQLNK